MGESRTKAFAHVFHALMPPTALTSSKKTLHHFPLKPQKLTARKTKA